MAEDNWKGYGEFKENNTQAERYYDLVRSLFFSGIERMCGTEKLDHALDLGCGNGDFTRQLTRFASHVTGVDSSSSLIEQAVQGIGEHDLSYIKADVLAPSIAESIQEGSVDLITAAWLHNHLGTEQEQHKLMGTILSLLKPDGRIVFLIPGLGFTTEQARKFFIILDWHQDWIDDNDIRKHGSYSSAGSPRQEMWVWNPMWLATQYAPHFQLEFLDVKGHSINHDGLGTPPLEPPFEVLMGRRR